MLRATANSGKDENRGEMEEPFGKSEQHKCGTGENDAQDQDASLSQPFGEKPGGNLSKGDRCRQRHLERTDLGVGQGEGCRPEGQQYIETVGEAVADKVCDATCCEDAAS